MRIAMSQHGNLLLSRPKGADIALRFPAKRTLTLDFSGVKAASPSFLDEVMRVSFDRGVKEIKFANCSDRMIESLHQLAELQESGQIQRSKPLIAV